MRLLFLLLFLPSVFTSLSAPQWTAQAIKSFGNTVGSEALIRDPLLQASDGYLYGVAQSGGSQDKGALFKLSPNGSNYVVLHSFDGLSGSTPVGGLIEGATGVLFGVTRFGGVQGQGTVFRLKLDGSDFAILHSFTTNEIDGALPGVAPTLGSDGTLYGTSSAGGLQNVGTIFKLSTSGTGFGVLHSFSTLASDGSDPRGALTEGPDGALYGTTFGGGTEMAGVVFKISKAGSGYTVLHHFTPSTSDGDGPVAGVTIGADGALYGTTSGGGVSGVGTIFKISASGSAYSVLRHFALAGGDGQEPAGKLIKGVDHVLYGTTRFGGSRSAGTVFKLNGDGSGFVVLRSFGTLSDGQIPFAGLLQGNDGLLYGTTSSAGAVSGNTTDGGTVFKLSTNGAGYAVLHSFSRTGRDGQGPGWITEASDGLLYGTTASGGDSGGGAIFKIARDGTDYSILWNFKATNAFAGFDQVIPSKLIQGTDGALYGMTQFGGAFGLGMIFKIETNGQGFTVLRNFTSAIGDPRSPLRGLVEGKDGLLYGATQFGGLFDGGAVFKISKNGTGFTVLHHFERTVADGHYPYADLTQGSDGLLYGTTSAGGAAGFGTVFKLSTNGLDYATLHNFGALPGDGKYPRTVVIEGADGALYGTTTMGGNANNGTIFKLNRTGSGYAVLHTFPAGAKMGSDPSQLVEAPDGTLYGTLPDGGSGLVGAVFSINKDGSNFIIRYSFPDQPGHGKNPFNGLILTRDGAFYGATANGGHLNLGTLIRFGQSNPNPVTLRIARLDNTVVISWPETAGLGQLQQTSSLNPVIDWTPLDTEIEVADGEYRAAIPIGQGPSFFRLR